MFTAVPACCHPEAVCSLGYKGKKARMPLINKYKAGGAVCPAKN